MTDKLPKRWADKDGNPVRLMTVCEGYAMMRRPGAVPFLFPAKDLLAGEPWLNKGPFMPAAKDGGKA